MRFQVPNEHRFFKIFEPRSPDYSAKSAIFDVRVFHAVILHDLQDVFLLAFKSYFLRFGVQISWFHQENGFLESPLSYRSFGGSVDSR